MDFPPTVHARWLPYRDRYLPQSCRVLVSQDAWVVQWVSRAGYVWSGSYHRFTTSDAKSQLSELWLSIHEGPMKRKDMTKVGGGLAHASALELKDRFPRLGEFLTAARWEGSAEVREAPTLTVWAQSGQWRCSLRDRAEGVVLWLVADRLEELLVMLDGLCLDAKAHWRHDDPANERNGKRRGKGA